MCLAIACGLLCAAILIGAAGLHVTEHQSWLDSCFNAVLVLVGLGIQGEVKTSGGKVFTIMYSIFGAFMFYLALGILFSPILHRFFHYFHLKSES